MELSVDGTAAGDVTAVEWPSEAVRECPYEYYEQLREDAPVMKYPGRNEYLVSRWEDVCYVSRTPEIFSNTISAESDPGLTATSRAHGGIGENEPMRGTGRYTPITMAMSDPPEHKLKRTLGLKVLKDQQQVDLVQSKVDVLIDAWIDRGSCDFSAEFANLLPVQVITDLLGLPAEETETFRRWSASEGAGARYLPADELRVEVERAAEAREYIRSTLLERRDNPRDDGISDLVQAQIEQDGEFDLAYLSSETWVLMFAGNVTTAHMLASAMAKLCLHPEEMARVRTNHALIPSMLDETLRMESPVQWRQRLVLQDTELRGVKIPAGASVILMYGAGNRDPERFPDPEAFQADRKNATKHQLAFGYGIHRCLGAPLARLEGRIAFETLFRRLDNIRLDEARTDLSFIESVHLLAPKRVSITFDKAV